MTAQLVMPQARIALQRFEVIYNGVDCQRFIPAGEPQRRKRLGLAEDEVIAVTVASLTHIKNHLGLLQVIALLKRDTHPKLRFLFLGDGQMRGEIEGAIHRLGLADRVILAGASDQVAAYLQTADLFILPSLLEEMSNAILEAMAAGLPVIANRVGGNPELVVEGETGLLCIADDRRDWADAISSLAGDKYLRK